MAHPKIVSRDKWLVARKKILAKEKKGHASTGRADRRAASTADVTTNHLLDLTAYGRMQDWEDSPRGWPRPASAKGLGVKHHDKYRDLTKGSCNCST